MRPDRLVRIPPPTITVHARDLQLRWPAPDDLPRYRVTFDPGHLRPYPLLPTIPGLYWGRFPRPHSWIPNYPTIVQYASRLCPHGDFTTDVTARLTLPGAAPTALLLYSLPLDGPLPVITHSSRDTWACALPRALLPRLRLITDAERMN